MHTQEQWQDWHWQLANSVRQSQLADVNAARIYPMQVTPFYMSLAKSQDMTDPVYRQCIPQACELEDEKALDDPLCEEEFSPVPRLVHRYKDRTLFLTCSCCAVRCRHCMRKRVWAETIIPPSDDELAVCCDYLRQHSEVREVLISGGDPMVLEDAQIKRVLSAFASVPSIEMLRIGTRALVALPMRFTEELCRILGETGKTVWLAAHFNHPQELSREAEEATLRLMRHGVPVVNQSVLLKGINDDADVLGKLFTDLLRMRIKPYYLFHGDPVHGTTCFRTGIQAGLKIMAELRGKISGLAIPAFAFDLPEGGGKVRLEPDFCRGCAEDGAPVFEKLNGDNVAYR